MTAPPALLASTAVYLDARLASAQATARAPSMVAAVVRDGRACWTGARGRRVRRPDAADPEGERPEAGTQFRIGSITKTLTAVLVLQLRDEGRLDLADPLSAHLSDTPFGDVSVRSLLAHSSGVPAEPPGPWWERSTGRTWPDLRTVISDFHQVLPAGRQHHYSNLGYALLGELVSRQCSAPWRDAVQERLLLPLDMARTSYEPADPVATGFSVHPYAGTLTDEPAQDTLAMAPAGQLWSTAADLCRWAAFLAAPDPAVLAPDTVEEMTIVQSGDPGGAWHDGYGLGLRLLARDGVLLVGHTGSMPGFLAGAFVDRRSGVGAVALANATRGFDPATLTGDLITTVLEHEPALSPEWVPDDEAGQAGDLLGPWYWGNTPFTVSVQQDLLVLDTPAGDQPTRFRAGPDSYFGLDGYFTGEELRVVRRADGSVSHLDVATFVLTRTPYDPAAPIPGGTPAP